MDSSLIRWEMAGTRRLNIVTVWGAGSARKTQVVTQEPLAIYALVPDVRSPTVVLSHGIDAALAE